MGAPSRASVARMDDVISVELIAYAIAALIGAPIVIWRVQRDRRRQGRLSVHDGERYRAPTPAPPWRRRYRVQRQPTAQGTRVAISGVELAAHLGFALHGKTVRSKDGVSGRLIVEGTNRARRAERVFARSDVNAAVAVVCGAVCGFHRVDLFPGGDLAVIVDDGDDTVDLAERLLLFANALDEAIPFLDDDDVDLGATSGTTSSAAFSIEIRS